MKMPRAYQLECIERGTRQNLLIADQCGLGKTLEACCIAKSIVRPCAETDPCYRAE
jgi:ERCC4-related helicase